MTALLGTVLERDGSVYRVATEAGRSARCSPGRPSATPPRRRRRPRATGARSRGELHAIVGVEPRTALLERRVPEGRGARPVAANVDQVFVSPPRSTPARSPAHRSPARRRRGQRDLRRGGRQQGRSRPGTALIDRFGRPATRSTRRAPNRRGIAEIGAALAGRISVVTGPSGAGKSSLLNHVQPGLSSASAS